MFPPCFSDLEAARLYRIRSLCPLCLSSLNTAVASSVSSLYLCPHLPSLSFSSHCRNHHWTVVLGVAGGWSWGSLWPSSCCHIWETCWTHEFWGSTKSYTLQVSSQTCVSASPFGNSVPVEIRTNCKRWLDCVTPWLKILQWQWVQGIYYLACGCLRTPHHYTQLLLFHTQDLGSCCPSAWNVSNSQAPYHTMTVQSLSKSA